MAKKYLDKDGLLYFWQKIKNLFATKSSAVSTITRYGTTFTATKADGTTFTFDQQDSTVPKTVTTPLMNGTASIGSETAYAAGDHVHPSDSTKADVSLIGSANGICPLNASSLIDSQYLPSFVDDVIEAYPRSGETELSSTWLATGSASGSAITPESGKIYTLMVDSTSYSANSQFRWGGTAYVKMNDGGVSSITNTEIDTIVAS